MNATMDSHVEFPGFLYGPFSSLHRRTLGEARRWAEAYRQTGGFPLPSTEPVPDAAVVYAHEATDLLRKVPQWRSYFVSRLCDAVLAKLGWNEHVTVAQEFETHVLQTPWGALDAAVTRAAPFSVGSVTRRIDSLLRFWEPLDTLRYVGPMGAAPVPLAELAGFCYAGPLGMWRDRPPGEVRQDLRAAVDAMNAAGPGERQDRLVRVLAGLAGAEERLREEPRLTDPGWLREQVRQLPDAERDELYPGQESRLLRVLYDLARKHNM